MRLSKAPSHRLVRNESPAAPLTVVARCSWSDEAYRHQLGNPAGYLQPEILSVSWSLQVHALEPPRPRPTSVLAASSQQVSSPLSTGGETRPSEEVRTTMWFPVCRGEDVETVAAALQLLEAGR